MSGDGIQAPATGTPDTGMCPDPDDPRPPWWVENEELRERLELPAYTPPRFRDGTFTHVVTAELEERHGRSIRFFGEDTRYPDDLQVRVDGEPVFSIGRFRDRDGNTVYEMTADEFRRELDQALADD